MVGLLLCRFLCPLLQLLDGILRADIMLAPVCLDGLLTVGGQLRLPVALAILLLCERILLVLIVVGIV